MSQSSLPYLIDSHAHLNFQEFSGDLPEVLKRAKGVGVLKMICVGTDFETNEQVAALAREHKNIFSTVGFHPIHVSDYCSHPTEEIVVRLEKQIADLKPVAIGEIGLDFFRRSDREDQKVIFKAMLEMSIRHNLPVIIHCRDAFEEMFEILENYRGRICGVLHCFTGGVAEAKRATDLGLHIGFTGLITYKNNERILDAINMLSLEKILVETDCPYLAPMPVRGRRCEPAFVKYTAEKIAEVKSISFEVIARATSENVDRVFGI